MTIAQLTMTLTQLKMTMAQITIAFTQLEMTIAQFMMVYGQDTIYKKDKRKKIKMLLKEETVPLAQTTGEERFFSQAL